MSQNPIYDDLRLQSTPLGSAKTYDPLEEHTTVVETMPCILCGKSSQVTMNEKEVEAYKSGAPIAQAFKHWPAEMRELLMTGTHPQCWDEMFEED